MINLENTSIRIKLMIALGVSAGFALIISLSTLQVNALSVEIKHLRSDMAVFARLLASNSTPALSLHDRDGVMEVLSALVEQREFLGGYVYGKNGMLFADYTREGFFPPPSRSFINMIGLMKSKEHVEYLPLTDSGSFIWEGNMHLNHPILSGEKEIGRIHLIRNFKGLNRRTHEYMVFTYVVAAITLFTVLLLSLFIQKIFSRPIIDILNAMRVVAKEEDYSLRIERRGNDELNAVIGEFNMMLETIQLRDIALGHKVDERTRELAEANGELELKVEELRLMRDKSESVNLAKSQFFANMSHEIRTPMNAVLGMAEVLRGTPLSLKQASFVKSIQKSGEGLLKLINDILDFSKIGAGKLSIEKIDFDLAACVEEAVHALGIKASKKNVDLVMDFVGDIPPLVQGDPVRLCQVLTNLLENAIKFTERGEVILLVTCAGSKQSAVKLLFSVRDTGIGIEESRKKLLFEPFTQADGSTTRRYGGSGLGLTISKDLVLLMGGEIGVESSPGTGSTFWFHLPFDLSPGEPVKRQYSERVEGKSLLLITKNPVLSSMIKKSILNWGMRCDHAKLGEEGFSLLKSAGKGGSPYDFMLIDFDQEWMGSEKSLKLVQGNPLLGETRFILLTPPDFNESDYDMDWGGSLGRLIKPVRSLDLYQVLTGGQEQEWEQTLEPPLVGDEPPTLPGEKGQRVACRILLAEDNPANQELVLAMLDASSCIVVVANNGEEAVRASGERHYHMALMDCQMPDMDGYEATRLIRSRELEEGRSTHLPIIALTANAMDGDREKALEAGMDDYLSKPFTKRALFLKIEKNSLTTGESGLSGGPLEESSTEPEPDSPVELISSTASIIDETCLDSISSMASEKRPNLLNNVINLFLTDTRQLLQVMGQSVSNNDNDGLWKAAHRLKSASANLGAVQLSEFCRNLERECRENTITDPADLVGKIELEFNGVERTLRSKIGETE